MTKNKAAAVVAAVMTLVVAVLRIVLAPLLSQAESGWFRWSFLVMGLLLATVVVIFALGRLPKGEGRRIITGKPLLLTAMLGVLCGSLLTLMTLYDGVNWLIFEKTPPPGAVHRRYPDGGDGAGLHPFGAGFRAAIPCAYFFRRR